MYRRHLSDCAHLAKGNAWTRCQCPIWVQGSIGGEAVRRSLNTTNWTAASTTVHQWQSSGRIGVLKPELPDLGAWAQYLGSSTSTSVQMINGRTSMSLTLQYRFQALREGTFEIPAFDVVTAGGRTRETQPLEVTVTASPPPQSGRQDGGTSGELVGPEDVFITAEVMRDQSFAALKHLSDEDMRAAQVDDGWPELEPRVIR